ncbi:MAG: hypothetical protein ACRD2U_06810 [Terriglobales bacterium]
MSGTFGGLAGGLAMTRFSRPRLPLDDSSPQPLQYSVQEWDAASGIAKSVARRLTGRGLSPAGTRAGAAIVHYSMAAAGGLAYATLVRPHMAKSVWSGIFFGTAMWFMGNELLLPGLGLIAPDHRTLRMRANALGEHLVYGLAVETTCRRFDAAR